MPPGTITDKYEFVAIHMAAAHNVFITGINAIVRHAPNVPPNKVKPFMVFCLTVLDTIHHHHHIEETFYFPKLEEKLGVGTLSRNYEEHAEFVPQLDELQAYLKTVQNGEAQYDGTLIVERIHSFSDTMILHLGHEIPTLEASHLKAVFTEKELDNIDSQVMKIAMKSIDFYTSLPLGLVCANTATPWFPPFPLPIKLAARYWFSRRHSEAWEFGPLDLSGNPRR
ncbi:hypothetical protein BDP27DRAFT_1336228, partial [Rhodocollybia butyracea]